MNYTGLLIAILTQTVDTSLNGQAINVTYIYGADGQPVPHVNTINGQPPLNQASADAGLNGIAPGQLASGAIAANDAMFMKRRVA